MATSLESKLSELEARLKAENEAVMRDKMPRETFMHSPASRRQRSCKFCAIGYLLTSLFLILILMAL